MTHSLHSDRVNLVLGNMAIIIIIINVDTALDNYTDGLKEYSSSIDLGSQPDTHTHTQKNAAHLTQ